MKEYYTTISHKQVEVLRAVKDKKIRISENMLVYLDSLASQGRCFATDPVMENFRQTISRSIGFIINHREKETALTEYAVVEENIKRAFRQLCAAKTSITLKKIKAELDNATTRKNEQKNTI